MKGSDVIIELKGISKTYDLGEAAVHALRAVDLSVEPGGFLAIMGPSGSGKSTLMHVLGCIDLPDSGDYLLEGRSLIGMGKDQLAAIRNQRIGFVFQSFNLLPRTTALENVELPLLYGPHLPAEEMARRSLEALRSVNLESRAHHYPSQLSGGQQQRVAIARSIVNRPQMVLADEPTGNLDTRTSIEIMACFQELNEQGITIVLVTHEPDIASFAKRIVSFRDGRIVEDRPVVRRRRAETELAQLPPAQEGAS